MYLASLWYNLSAKTQGMGKQKLDVESHLIIWRE